MFASQGSPREARGERKYRCKFEVVRLGTLATYRGGGRSAERLPISVPVHK